MVNSIIVDVPLEQIEISESNVRSDLNSNNSKENIKELAENIRINGLLQPIVLTGKEGKPPYHVIVGQRRFLAHILLGEKTVKAIFAGEVDSTNALLLSLSENMCRQEMNSEDISRAITKLYKHFNNDVDQVQKHTGFSVRMIRSFVKVDAHATMKIKALLKEKKISMADAKRAIDASQGDNEKADILIDEIVKLSKYEKYRLVESGLKNPKANANVLLEEARQPKLEETIILNLPKKVHSALLAASEKLSIDIEELTLTMLVSWLKTNDFLEE